MAKNILPVNFQDDILSESMDNRRRYQIINNPDGTVSFVDVTEYDQVGSYFGQAQINATNEAVNESADKNRIIDDPDDLMANTQEGMLAGALAVKEIKDELTENLTKVNVYVGSDGKLHFKNSAGADTALNFSRLSASDVQYQIVHDGRSRPNEITFTCNLTCKCGLLIISTYGQTAATPTANLPSLQTLVARGAAPVYGAGYVIIYSCSSVAGTTYKLTTANAGSGAIASAILIKLI